MKLLRMLFADLGLVGLAVVFAWAIWYTVSEDLNETQKRPVEFVVETEPGLDVTPRTQMIDVVFQGPRRAVDALRAMQTPRIVRRLTSADLPAGADENRIDTKKEQLELDESLGGNALTVVDMEPAAGVSVKLFRVVVKSKVPVAPPEFEGAADLGLKYVLQSYTSEATIRIAASLWPSVHAIRTVVRKERLQGFAESLKDNPKTLARIVLEIHPSQRDLFTLLEPAELTASVQLSRVAEQEFVLPIQILDLASRTSRSSRRLQFAELNKPHFVPGDPPRVKLQVTGAPSALAALTASRVHAFVLGTDLAENQRNGDVPVHVADLPPGVALSQDYSVYVEEVR